jgi:two-component system response regulator FixJ
MLSQLSQVPSSEIHVVDPDPAVREGLQSLLSTLNLRVHTYPSAEAFLARSRPADGDCLILEVHLPGMSGIDLLAHLRKADVQLPTIMLACTSDTPMVVHAMRMGADDFLEKPFIDHSLLARVSKLLIK